MVTSMHSTGSGKYGMVQKALFLADTRFCERNGFRFSKQALTEIHKR